MADQFEIYKGSSGRWSWRLRGPKGRKIAAAGETFPTEAVARRAAQTAKERVAKAVVPEKQLTSPAKTSPTPGKGTAGARASKTSIKVDQMPKSTGTSKRAKR
jgi:uncharacterized protein YegP (UPF0339 family)